MALYEAAQDVKHAIVVLAGQGVSEAGQVIEHNQSVVFTALLLALAGVIGYAAYRDRRRRRVHKRIIEGQKMTKRERRRYLKTWFGDKITDLLEDAEHSGDISRSEKLNLYRVLSTLTGTRKELRPRPLTFAQRKEFKHELLKLKAKFFHEKAPSIPGPKPGEGVNVIPLVPKPNGAFSSKFLRKTA